MRAALLIAALLLPATALAGDILTVTGQPEDLGPGTLSTELPEFATTLTPDGSALYFNRVVDGRMLIRQGIFTPTGWRDDGPVSFSATEGNDIDPFISRSGDRMYFSSDRGSPATARQHDIWYVDRIPGGWSQAIRADALSSPSPDVFISEDRAGNLYFILFGEGVDRDRPATLMQERRDGAGFTKPHPVTTAPAGVRLNNPAISPDGNHLIMVANPGDGPALMYARKLSDGQWSPFTPVLDAEGHAMRGFAPYISNDQTELYYTFEEPGKDGQRGDRDLRRVRITVRPDTGG